MTSVVPCPARTLLALAAVVTMLGAGPVSTVRVDTWDAHPVGPLSLSGEWRRYPFERTSLKQPPAILQDDGRPVLQLTTVDEPPWAGR